MKKPPLTALKRWDELYNGKTAWEVTPHNEQLPFYVVAATLQEATTIAAMHAIKGVVKLVNTGRKAYTA